MAFNVVISTACCQVAPSWCATSAPAWSRTQLRTNRENMNSYYEAHVMHRLQARCERSHSTCSSSNEPTPPAARTFSELQWPPSPSLAPRFSNTPHPPLFCSVCCLNGIEKIAHFGHFETPAAGGNRLCQCVCVCKGSQLAAQKVPLRENDSCVSETPLHTKHFKEWTTLHYKLPWIIQKSLSLTLFSTPSFYVLRP